MANLSKIEQALKGTISKKKKKKYKDKSRQRAKIRQQREQDKLSNPRISTKIKTKIQERRERRKRRKEEGRAKKERAKRERQPDYIPSTAEAPDEEDEALNMIENWLYNFTPDPSLPHRHQALQKYGNDLLIDKYQEALLEHGRSELAKIVKPRISEINSIIEDMHRSSTQEQVEVALTRFVSAITGRILTPEESIELNEYMDREGMNFEDY